MRSDTGSRYGRIRFFTARIHHTEYVSSGSGQNFNEARIEVAAGPRRDRNRSRRRSFGGMSIIFSASLLDADNSPFGLGF